MLSTDQLEGLGKQIFMLEYLLNGLFPCQSDVVRLIRNKKREWEFNDKFEYRMLLSNTNTGGTLNSQVFRDNISLTKPGQLEYGVYRATYGTVMDGFEVDMMLNLETDNKKAAFERDYAMRVHSLRNNVAALFKNFAIHGRYGVVHQLRSVADGFPAPNIDPAYNPQPNVFTPTLATPFTIKVPINVFQSNFKRGKLLIKTTDTAAPGPVASGLAPWGGAMVSELYMVLDNQPGWLSLVPVGTTVSPWMEGQFLEVAQNREIIGQPPTLWSTAWSYGGINVTTGPFAGIYDQWTGTGYYTAWVPGSMEAITGAMEGLADIFPWYTNPAAPAARLGLDMPYRDQQSRLRYSTEQAGGWVVQQPGEHIIDAIMRGSFLTKATVPYADIGIWMNPVTRIQMGYEEGDNVRVLRDNFVQGPIVYQRGIKTTDYQIGNQVVKETVEDLNMPTDIIVIGPKDDFAYNCFDNSTMQIDQYIQETWGKSEPPPIEELAIPDEFLTKLDIKQRMVIGPPSMQDGALATFNYGNGIRHPKNSVSVALQEMGALYTEYPYTYTIVKLLKPIADITTV